MKKAFNLLRKEIHLLSRLAFAHENYDAPTDHLGMNGVSSVTVSMLLIISIKVYYIRGIVGTYSNLKICEL